MTEQYEKPKKKRQKRSWRQILGLSCLGLVICGVVTIVLLVIFGPVIGNAVLAPEIVYVDASYSLEIEPIEVHYTPPQFPASGGIFENGLYFQADNHHLDVTIEDNLAQISHTLTISNAGNAPVDGVFLIPLPSGEAYNSLQVEQDGTLIESTVYDVDGGRAYLQSLVQEYDDWSLLAYANAPFVEVDVFPLTGAQTITIRYEHPLNTINGLSQLNIPLRLPVTAERTIGQVDVTISTTGDSPLRNIYPATLDLMIAQDDPQSFTATTTLSAYTLPETLELYYSQSDSDLTANLITYRDNPDEDGYFVFLAQPAPLPQDQIVAQDVLLVLDQSGSMEGVKWQQAQSAAGFVLQNLNPSDRFYVTIFSDTNAPYSNSLSASEVASDAINWINRRTSGGGTNINDALLETLQFTDPERPATVIFMTDGQATTGITDTQQILENLRGAVRENVRIFVFGVGDGVNTTLLDSIAGEFRGATGYVRQNETIDAEISALYAQISSPVLTDIQIDFGDAIAGDMIPSGQLPDLYAGSSLIVTGRYREGGNHSITISGTASDSQETYTFDDIRFETERGGQTFVAQLWAARRTGSMLNTVRLGADNPELVNSIINSSLRYGIITQQTQFLLEQEGVLTIEGQQIANEQMSLNVVDLQRNQTGASAVYAADNLNALSSSRNYVPVQTQTVRFGSISSSYYRQEVVVTPTPLPEMSQNGVLITITHQSTDESVQYVLSMDEEAFAQIRFALQNNSNVTEVTRLPELISQVINARGIEQGVALYNEVYGTYLPLVPVDDALIDGEYVIAPPDIVIGSSLRTINGKTFILQDGVYMDTQFIPDTMIAESITVDSEDYNMLIESNPDLLPYLSIGTPLIITWDGTAYELTD